jgi:hypothetical protein
MKRLIVRYRVKPGRSAENQALIERVFEELHRANPAGLRYASFRLADGISFVHVVSIETTDGDNPLTKSAAFKAFNAGIGERCEEPPVLSEMTEVGSYRFFGP